MGLNNQPKLQDYTVLVPIALVMRCVSEYAAGVSARFLLNHNPEMLNHPDSNPLVRWGLLPTGVVLSGPEVNALREVLDGSFYTQELLDHINRRIGALGGGTSTDDAYVLDRARRALIKLLDIKGETK